MYKQSKSVNESVFDFLVHRQLEYCGVIRINFFFKSSLGVLSLCTAQTWKIIRFLIILVLNIDTQKQMNSLINANKLIILDLQH